MFSFKMLMRPVAERISLLFSLIYTYVLHNNLYRYNDGTTYEDYFDTVVFAVGRNAETLNIGIDKAGVAVNPKNGKILHDDCEKTNIEHVACF